MVGSNLEKTLDKGLASFQNLIGLERLEEKVEEKGLFARVHEAWIDQDIIECTVVAIQGVLMSTRDLEEKPKSLNHHIEGPCVNDAEQGIDMLIISEAGSERVRRKEKEREKL